MQAFSNSRFKFGIRICFVIFCLCQITTQSSFAKLSSTEAIKSAGIVVDSNPIDFDQLVQDLDLQSPTVKVVFLGAASREAGYEYKLTSWGVDEIEQVKSLLDEVMSTAPELLPLATGANGKILIGRAHEILAGPHKHRVYAITNCDSGVIILSDLVFRRTSSSEPATINNALYRTLIHELGHTIDCGYRFAYSKEWVSFAEPTISTIQNELDRLPSKNRYEAGPRLAEKFHWPSIYGSQNLQEALAEYFSCYYFHSGLLNSEFEKKFAPHFLKPTMAERQYVMHYRRGVAAYKRNQWDEAISEFIRARDLNPTVALLHVHLMDCYHEKNDLVNALKSSDAAIKCFTEAGVKKTAYYFEYSAMARYKLLLNAHRIEEARAYAAQLPGCPELTQQEMTELKDELKELLRKNNQSSQKPQSTSN